MNRVQRILTISDGEIIVENKNRDKASEYAMIPDYPHNFIVVRTLDANGDPVEATGGTFDVFVELQEGFGFTDLVNGTIDATKCGGRGITVDGEAQAASFDGNANAVKVVATGVTGCETAEIVILQNAS